MSAHHVAKTEDREGVTEIEKHDGCFFAFEEYVVMLKWEEDQGNDVVKELCLARAW